MPIESSEDSSFDLSEADKKLLNRFLILIRDNYKKADKAVFFMERRAGVSNACAVHNLRDALSHLATFLDSATPAEIRPDQLATAEEHLRRAIIEPYELGYASLSERFEPLYEKYKARLLPVKDRHSALNSAPNNVQIDAALSEIRELIQRGKTAKGNNRWDAEWEAGVQAFPDAYEKLAGLHSEIESKWYIYEQIERDSARNRDHARESRKQLLLTIWGIAATILVGILSIAITYLLSAR